MTQSQIDIAMQEGQEIFCLIQEPPSFSPSCKLVTGEYFGNEENNFDIDSQFKIAHLKQFEVLKLSTDYFVTKIY
jgi:hypothetical protein